MDDTQRISSQEILAKQFQYTIEMSQEAVFWMMHNGQFTYVNDQACRSLGYTREELLSLFLWDVDPDFPKERWHKQWEELKTSKQQIFETRHRRKDGHIFPVEVSACQIVFDGKEFHAAFVRDITAKKQAVEKMKETEQKLRLIVEHSTNLFYIHTPDNVLTYVSPQSLQFFDCEPEEAMLEWAELITDNPLNTAAIAAKQLALETGQQQPSYQVECLTKKGRKIWAEVHETPIIENNMVVGIAGSLTDITERKQAEEALRKSEVTVRNKLKAILEPESDISTLELGDIVDCEMLQGLMEDFYKVTGILGAVLDISGNVLVAVGWQDICTKFHRCHPETLKNCFESDTALTSDVPFGTFKKYRCKNNMWDMVTPLEVGGRHVGNIFIGQFFFDDDKIDREMFREQARLYGFDEQEYLEALDRTPRFSPEVVDAGMKFYAKLTKIISTLSFSSIKLSRILSEHTHLEEQLRQSQKMEAIGQLAGGVAHDYNNMLAVIIGNVELAKTKAKRSESVEAHLEQILYAAKKSSEITSQLLTFARKQIINPKILNLNVVLEDMLKMLRNLLGENIELTWQPKDNLWPVKIDASQLNQVLANLCVNARDAIVDVGKMTIETGNVSFDQEYCNYHPGFIPGDFAMFAVSDNGCGMDSETKDKIFEPFYTTKGVGEGTGLGLATVYGIVKQSNGFINVYSELDQGTTFKIYLPRCLGEEVLPQKAAPNEVQMGHGETVLLVEDEKAIITVITTILEDLNYKVLAFNSPTEALRKTEAHQGEIQLLLTDVVMPGMNGRDLAKQIQDIQPNMKTLYMSGYTANVIAHHGVLDVGINFIQKPFSQSDLSIRIRDALNSDS